MTAVLVLVAALGAAPNGQAARAPVKVLYVGDSVAAQNASALASALRPAEFHDAMGGGAAICDYLAGTPTWLPQSAKFDRVIREVRRDGAGDRPVRRADLAGRENLVGVDVDAPRTAPSSQ